MKASAWSMAAVGLLVAAAAVAGPYDQVYGVVESGKRSTAHKHEEVGITKIDGQSTRNARRPDPIAPGPHAIEVSFSSARTVVENQTRTVSIDIQPCKRYRIVAHYENPVSGKWEPVVQSIEDIGECRKKFMQGAPAK